MMHLSAHGSVRMEGGEAEIIVRVEHPDPILRHAHLPHSLAGDGLQRLPIAGREVFGVFLDVVRDRLQAARRGGQADHRRRFLAPQLAGGALESFCEAAKESVQVAWRFHGESIPRIHTPRKRDNAPPGGATGIGTPTLFLTSRMGQVEHPRPEQYKKTFIPAKAGAIPAGAAEPVDSEPLGFVLALFSHHQLASFGFTNCWPVFSRPTLHAPRR
jgi:hypothetical protein